MRAACILGGSQFLRGLSIGKRSSLGQRIRPLRLGAQAPAWVSTSVGALRGQPVVFCDALISRGAYAVNLGFGVGQHREQWLQLCTPPPPPGPRARQQRPQHQGCLLDWKRAEEIPSPGIKLREIENVLSLAV